MFALGALIGVAFGGAFFVQLDPAMIQIAVGLFILWSILMKPPAFMRRSAGIAGAFSSFLSPPGVTPSDAHSFTRSTSAGSSLRKRLCRSGGGVSRNIRA